jgi:hypothetical protein
MNHSDAVKEMAAERYLLDELSPVLRDAFEEHMFDCPECTLDVRSGSMFIGETKTQLPAISLGSLAANRTPQPQRASKQWFSWLRPVYAVPVMAALLLVVGYQNLIILPALHHAANQPRIVQTEVLYGATRGASHQSIAADRTSSVGFSVELPVDLLSSDVTSISFELINPQGKTVWTNSIPAPAQGGGDSQLSVVVPGSTLENGAYTLNLSGVRRQGDRTPIEQYVFEIVMSK